MDLNRKRNLWEIVIPSGILVGILDGAAAVIQTLAYGGDPVMVFQFIASGVFGNDAFSGGLPMAFYGLIFHLCIAMTWTTLFFLIYPKLELFSKNRFITGLGYGLFIWLVMTRIVLPLSNVPQVPFRISSAIIEIVILMTVIGLPLSFIANKFYSLQQKDNKLSS